MALTILVDVGAVAAVGDFRGAELRLAGTAGGEEVVEGVAWVETTLDVEVGDEVKACDCIFIGTGTTAAAGLTTSWVCWWWDC